MKIVNVIHRYPPAVGGAETWCQEVCRFLAHRGHQVEVLTLAINREEEYWRDSLETGSELGFGKLQFDDGVYVRRYTRSLPVHSVYHSLYKILLDRLLNIYFYGPHSNEMYARMWKKIRKADIVFLHTLPHPHNYIGFFLAKFFNKKVIIVPHFHPSHPFYERKSLYWLLNKCDAVITVSNYEKEYLRHKGIPEEKLFVTGNAIHPDDYQSNDLEAFKAKLGTDYGLRSEDKIVVFLGRKTPEKGVQYLIEAARQLLSEMPLRLFLVGPCFEWYDKLYASLSNSEKERIIELGILSHRDKVNLLHLAHLLVLPSKYEAFGIVFLEAWACRTPVLGTTEGAMPSIIGQEGLVCEFGNSLDLKMKIKQVLSDDSRAAEMGSMGKAKVMKTYTWNAIGDKVEQAVKATYGRKKIILCSNAYPPSFIGGAELIAHRQAQQLQKLGHEVVVFAGEPKDRRKRYAVRCDTYEGITTYRACLHQRDYSADYYNFYHGEIHPAFSKLLDHFAPDIVHFHNLIGLSVGLIQVARQRNIKTVLTFHDYWGLCHRNTITRQDGSLCGQTLACEQCRPMFLGQRWKGVPARMRRDYIQHLLRMADHYISPSRYLAEQYIRAGIDPSKMSIIPYGIDLERFAHLNLNNRENSKAVRFSFIGYLGAHKGVLTIIEALQHIDHTDKIKINLVGDGELKNELKTKLKTANLETSVRLWGKVSHARITEVYKETDVLILPSIWPENHPVSINEAMAAGLPVIGSRIGGIPELIEDNKTGYLFEPGNAVDLAQKMTHFIMDRTKLIEFGRNGFEKISAYSLSNQVKRMVVTYDAPRIEDNHSSAKYFTILCAGKNLSPCCLQALHQLSQRAQQPQLEIVMLDWVEKEQIQTAHLLWVVDPAISQKDVVIGLRNKLPLLVPVDNEALRSLCLMGDCGFYYQDSTEILVCLDYLTSNETLRTKLGCNGFKYAYSTSGSLVYETDQPALGNAMTSFPCK